MTWLMLACGVLATGCYRHVVKAEGPGARSVDTFEPAMPDEKPNEPRRVR